MKQKMFPALLLAVLVSTPVFASKVTEIVVSHSKDVVVARISIDGRVRFVHETEVPKNGRPDRLIVDVLSATHHLGSKSFENLSTGMISSIRTSQYAVKPEKIVRIVFDLKKVPVYQIRAEEGSILIVIADRNAPFFASWSSRQKAKSAPKPSTETATVQKPKSLPVIAQKSTGIDAIVANKKIDADRMLSLGNKDNTAISANDKTKTPKSKTPATKVAARPKTKAVKSEPKVVKSEVKAKPKVVKSVPEKKSKSPALTSKQTEQTLARYNKPDKSSTVVKKSKSVPSGGKSASPAQTVTTAKITKPSSVKSVEKKKAVKPAPSSKRVAVSTPAQTKSAKKPKAISSKKASKKSTPQVASKPAVVKKSDKVAKKKLTSPTSRFRRSTSAKLRKTMVAQFPKRLVIQYKSRGRRDPFSSLIEDAVTGKSTPIERRIPNVEGVKLVGTIESDGGTNRALLEDKSGYSYILKSGDKVRNGYVLRVEEQRVYFQIFEYGWSRTIALTIDEW